MGPFIYMSNIRITSEALSTSCTGGVLAEVRVSIFKAVSLVAAPAEVTTEFDELLLTKFDLQGVGASLCPVSGSVIIIKYLCTKHWMDVTR